MYELDSDGSELGSQASSCNYGNERLDFTNTGKDLHQRSNYHLVKDVRGSSPSYIFNVPSLVSTAVWQHI